PASVAASGSDVLVQCRANSVRAKQVPIPVYKRAKNKPRDCSRFMVCSSQVVRLVTLNYELRYYEPRNCELRNYELRNYERTNSNCFYPPWPLHLSTPRNAANGPTLERY